MARYVLFLIALLFAFEQNRYFGWNWTPQSYAELIADGVTAILFALAWCAA